MTTNAYLLSFVKIIDKRYTEYLPLVEATLKPFGGKCITKVYNVVINQNILK